MVKKENISEAEVPNFSENVVCSNYRGKTPACNVSIYSYVNTVCTFNLKTFFQKFLNSIFDK